MALTKVTGELINVNDLDLTNVGTIQADSVAGDADTNTALTFSGSDVITVTTGGSTAFTVDASQVVNLSQHLTLVDDKKVKLGAGTDLQIYHDGTNSYIANTTGALKIATETSGIAVTIGHTTSETTVADNLTVTGTITGTLATAAQTNITSLGTLTALTGGTGDLVWDTTTLVVDSSANKVGIGTTSPVYGLDVRNTIYSSVAATTKNLTLGDSTNGTTSAISTNNNSLIFYHDGSTESLSLASGLTTSANAINVTNGNSTFTTATAWGATLTLKNTNDDASPAILSLHKDPTSGHSTLADNDYIGFINMKAKDDAGNAHTYVELAGVATDVSSGAETSKFTINTWGAGTEYATNIVATGGKVGIGTASPAGALDVVSAGYGSWPFYVRRSANGAQLAGIYESSNGDGGHGMFYLMDGGGTTDVKLSTNGVSWMNGGTLGIGTTSPDSMLHLYKATGSGALEPEIKIENNHNTSSVTDGAGRLTFYSDDSNNAGIPDNAWLGQVRFMGDDKDGSAQEFEYAYMVGQARDPGSGSSRKGGLSFYTRNGNSMTESLTVTENKVGIGDTGPSYTLDVNTSGNASAFRVSNGTNGQDVNCAISNGGTSAGDDTLLALSTTNGAGDPYIRMSIAGVEDWHIGVDNSDSDNLHNSMLDNKLYLLLYT